MGRNIRFGIVILLTGLSMACAVANRSTAFTRNKTTRFGIAAPNLEQLLDKWRRVEMPFDALGLTRDQRRVVGKLVDASRYLDDIYWRQSDPDALELYKSVEHSKDPFDVELRRLLVINGSRFDLLDDNKPFVGTHPMPPGHSLYPPDLTHAEIEAYVKAHPDSKEEIFSPYRIIRREDGDLAAIPYNVAYRNLLKKAAKDLREAAGISSDTKFAKFLRMRARALLNDNYYPSDIEWLELKNPKIDVIFGPYETYMDGILGVKASYGAAVLIRNNSETRKLALYQSFVPMIQRALPLPRKDLPSMQGHVTPMEVVDSPFRAGDLAHGYQAVAVNLPNDPRIHQEKGTKKIFFKNFMDARVNDVILPLARQIMESEQAAQVTPGAYLAVVVMHEISHGLGPAFARVGKKKESIREAIGSYYSALEEAKADVVGMYGLDWLVDHNVLPKEKLNEYYSSYVAGIFRTVRFGTGEAHGQAEIMEFNYLNEQEAITWDAKAKRYVIIYRRMPGTLAELARKLLEIEATGNRADAEALFKRYDKVSATLKNVLRKVRNVPVDIYPVFSFREKVE